MCDEFYIKLPNKTNNYLSIFVVAATAVIITNTITIIVIIIVAVLHMNDVAVAFREGLMNTGS